MKRIIITILFVVFSFSTIACLHVTHECMMIDDEVEKSSNLIGSARVERYNLGQTWWVEYSWRNRIGLFLDFNKRVGLGAGPTLPNSSFYSDANHQWWICERPNGYRYAILRGIND